MGHTSLVHLPVGGIDDRSDYDSDRIEEETN
jgi:hypothetical protein